MNAITTRHARIDEIMGQWSTPDDTPAFPVTDRPSSSLHHPMMWLRECHERSRQRWYLQNLDDRLLRDIGLTAADVRAELRKWPWMK